MLNRALQVRLVKNHKADGQKIDTIASENEDKTELVLFGVDQVVKKIAWATLAYVVLDTARQVMVAKANR